MVLMLLMVLMVLMVVLFLGSEVIMNNIGIDEEYMMDYSVGTSDSITYEKNLWGHCCKIS